MAKFSSFGGKPFSKTGRFGSGNMIRKMPEGAIPVLFRDFRGGFDSRTLRDGTPPNASQNAIDIQPNAQGSLIALPGTSPVLTLTGHPSQQMALHASLSGWSELLFFSPPYVGIMDTAGAVTWINLALIDSGQLFRWTIYGEDLIFYNGAGSPFIRRIGQNPVVAPTIPAANSYASFAGRVFAGGAVIDGQYEPMGMYWSSVSGDPQDFTGAGAEPELLIDAMLSGDHIVACRTMGLGMMAILCRQSVWVARFTGDLLRPADFQPRVGGAGCVSEPTARLTPIGVMYLAEDGVRVFDGNNSSVKSARINQYLLPILQTRFNDYSATYDPIRNRYLLHTLSETWIYDITYDFWLKSSLVTTSGTLYAEQITGTTWGQLTGDWNSLNATTWQQLSPHETDVAEMHFLNTPQLGETSLGKFDLFSATMFGAPMIPVWDTPINRGLFLNQLIETKAILIEYRGSGTIRFYLPDNDAQFQQIITQPLPVANFPTEVWLPLVHTGLGAGLRVELAAGSIELLQMQLVVAQASQKIESAPFYPRDYFPDFNQ